MPWSYKMSRLPSDHQLSTPTYFLVRLRNILCIPLSQEPMGRWRKIRYQNNIEEKEKERGGWQQWVYANQSTNQFEAINHLSHSWLVDKTLFSMSEGRRDRGRTSHGIPCPGFFQAHLFLQQCLPSSSNSSSSCPRRPSSTRWNSPVSHRLSNVKKRVLPKPRIHVLHRPRSNAHLRARPPLPSRSAPWPSKSPSVNRSEDQLEYHLLDI